MIQIVELQPGLTLEILGTPIDEQSDVGYTQDFEIENISIITGDPMMLIEWCEAKKGKCLIVLSELCKDQINSTKGN